MVPPTARERPAPGDLLRISLLLLSALIAVYTASYGGVFRVDDEHILAARAQSLALWGKLEEPQVYGNARERDLAALGGAATQVEPGQSIFGAGLYRLGMILGVAGGQAAFTLGIYVTAATAVVVFLTTIALGHPIDTAVWCTLLFGVGTMAWPYATTFLRDPLVALMIAVGFLGLALAAQQARSSRAGGAALIALGLLAGALVKNTAVAVAPALVVGWLITIVRRGKRGWAAAALAAAAAGVTVLVAAHVPSSGVLSRYSLGYYLDLTRHFAGSLSLGLPVQTLGPLVSPAKSIFIFSPPLLLALGSLGRGGACRRGFAAAAILCPLLLSLGQALFYRDAWSGAFGWGLRFMLPAIPPLIVLAAPVVDRLLRGVGARRWLWLMLAVGIAIQWSAAWMPWQRVYDAWLARGLDPFGSGAAWDVRLLAVPGQLARWVDPGNWDLAWLRVLRLGYAEAALVPLACLALGALALALLQHRGVPNRRGRAILFSCTLAVAGIALPLVPSLSILRDDPAGGNRPEIQSALVWVEQRVGLHDAVVVDAYVTPLWTAMMSRWTAPIRWYSLPFEIPGTEGVDSSPGGPPSPATLDLFTALASSADRIWYVTSQEAPDFSLGRETGWLDRQMLLESSRIFDGESQVQVSAYVLRR